MFYSWVTSLCTCVLVLSTSIEDDSVWSWLDVSGWLDDGSPRSISFIPPFLNGRKISSICTIISKERRTKLQHFPCCVEAVQQQNTTQDYDQWPFWKEPYLNNPNLRAISSLKDYKLHCLKVDYIYGQSKVTVNSSYLFN